MPHPQAGTRPQRLQEQSGDLVSVDPLSVSEVEAADGGRVWSTVTVAGGHEIARLFLQALRPRTRLRVRHESGRQGVMLAANLGLGVAGFQHATIETELPL